LGLTPPAIEFLFQSVRNLLDAERGTVEILAGARFLDVDSKLTLRLSSTGPTPSASQSVGVRDGVIGVIGVKGNVNISQKWCLPDYFDAGTGQSDLAWQALGGVGYRFNRGNVVRVYRYRYWDFKPDTLLENMSFSGPASGTVFEF